MARRKYQFPDRASAEAAHDRQEALAFVLSRVVGTLAVSEGGFGHVRVASGEYGLIVRESGTGFIEGVMIFDRDGQKPIVRPFLDLDEESQGWHVGAIRGDADCRRLSMLANLALRKIMRAA